MREYNFSLLLDSLKDHDVNIKEIGVPDVVFLRKGKKFTVQTNTTTNRSSYVSGWIADDKYYAKSFLKHRKIPVPNGSFFTLGDKKIALKKAKEIGFPLVLKPTQMGHGDFVISNIQNSDELEKVLDYLLSSVDISAQFLVEEHIHGEEYRCFVTETGFFAAVQRQPAAIVGDGVSTVKELIDVINFSRMNPRKNCLCTIKIDWLLEHHLEKKGRTLRSVPKFQETLQLRPTTNVSLGGSCCDVTDIAHPSVKEFSKKVLQTIPFISVLGIDLICQDISQDLGDQKYSVCELNTMPGLSLHTVPGTGTSRPVDQEVAKIIMSTLSKDI